MPFIPNSILPGAIASVIGLVAVVMVSLTSDVVYCSVLVLLIQLAMKCKISEEYYHVNYLLVCIPDLCLKFLFYSSII